MDEPRKKAQSRLDNWIIRDTKALAKEEADRISSTAHKDTNNKDQMAKNRLRILAVNVCGLPSKRANKHKLKTINQWMDQKDVGIFIETGINEDNNPINIHDEFRYERHNCQVNRGNA